MNISPVPWSWKKIGDPDESESLLILDARGEEVACITIVAECYYPTDEANARLLAAAPELLDALEGVLRALREYTDGQETLAQAAVLDQAEAAIKKATGE